MPDAGPRNGLDLPHPLSAIAAVLFEHARTRRREASWKCLRKRGNGAIKPRIGAPAEMLGPHQHLFHTHLEDHVRVRTDPRSPRGEFAKQRIERGARFALVDGVHPHQDAIDLRELFAHIVGEGFVVDGRLGVDMLLLQRLKDSMKAIVVRRRSAAGVHVAPP